MSATKFEFDGDLNNISEYQLEFIEEVLKKNKFDNAKVTIQGVGEAGDNYVAIVKRLIVEKNGKTFNMIAKLAPPAEWLRAQMRTKHMFSNENVMYTEVFPKFTELEKAANVPEEIRLRYPACYGCFMKEPYEVILLEDLQVANFKMLDRFKSLQDDSVRLVFESFAKLHGLSYALKHKEPKTYNYFGNKLLNNWELVSNEDVRSYFTSIEEDAIALLKTQKHKNAIKGILSNFEEILGKLKITEGNSKYSVIQQGDSWTNNIMFVQEEGKSVQCCMIDYQISKLNSPVADLHYMIFNCTDYDIRSKHYHEWIDYYHSELSKILSLFGLKIDSVYSRERLDADLKRYSKAALGYSLLLAAGLFKSNDEAAKIKEYMNVSDPVDMEGMLAANKLSAMAERTQNMFIERVEGVIKSFIDLGYISV